MNTYNINLFGKFASFLWFVVGRCQMRHEGNKLTTKLISAWSKFPISILTSTCMLSQRTIGTFSCGRLMHFFFVSKKLRKKKWEKYSWDIFIYLNHFFYVSFTVWKISWNWTSFPQTCERERKKNDTQTHKSHGSSHSVFFKIYSKQSQVTSNFHADGIYLSIQRGKIR